MRKTYPSDITRAQFEIIRPFLERARKRTRPREADLYDVFCAVLYVLKSGCQWRMLPSDFPKWQTVYYYFHVWKKEKKQGRKKLPSVLEEVLKKNEWRGSYTQWTERENKYGHH